MDAPAPKTEGVAAGTKLFLAIGGNKVGDLTFLTAPALAQHVGLFVGRGLYSYLRYHVDQLVRRSVDEINEEADTKLKAGEDAVKLNEASFNSLLAGALKCLDYIFQPDFLEAYEEIRWDPEQQCLIDIDEYNMDSIQVEFARGVLDNFEVPEDKERKKKDDDTTKAPKADASKPSDDSTYAGPAVFNISSNQNKTVTFTESGEVQGQPETTAEPPITLHEAASKAGISVKQLQELLEANKAQSSQPSPNASPGNNEAAAGIPSQGGTGVI
jgi:hypothetical protein